MKYTLQSKFLPTVEQHLSDSAVDPYSYKNTLRSIHSQSVANTIATLDPNPLLGTRPPAISPSEKRLTRRQRTTLAQLRSGHCRLLGDYKICTGLSSSALCPECLFRRQTVPHIFNCDAAPTNLSLCDLWINPVTVVEHLVNLQSFSALVPPDPPPPSPPPEPPP